MTTAVEPYYTLYRDGHAVIHYVRWSVMVNSGRFVLGHPNDVAREYMHFERNRDHYPTCIACIARKGDPAWGWGP